MTPCGSGFSVPAPPLAPRTLRYSRLAGLSWIVFLAALQLAYGDVLHFVRYRQSAVLLDRSVVPAGGEVPIKYDAGDRWIPYFVTSTPSILKSVAPLVDEVLFDPPIDGIANKVVPYYQRIKYPNSIASHVIPNDHGDVVGRSQRVRITARLGNFYIVETKGALPPYLPVSALTVDPAALASGEVPPIPSPPTAAPAPTAPASGTAQTTAPTAPAAPVAPQGNPVDGPLFAKLQVPYSLVRLPLAEGNYVQIRYDGGDDWVLDNEGLGGSPTISKAAVEVMERVNYFVALGGKMTRPSKLYNTFPDLRKDPTTLDQLQAFASLNADLKAGDEVVITAKEGNDYLITVQGHGVNGIGRVPAAFVEIVAGDPSSGSPTRVPAKPQSENPVAAGYYPPSVKPESPGDFLTNKALPATVFACLLAGAGAIFRMQASRTENEEDAKYGVPHTKFERTEDGFKCTFVRSSKAFYIATHLQSQMKSPNSLAAFFFILFMAAFLLALMAWYGIESFFKTVIVVDRESVSINGNRMSKDEFGSFHIFETLSNDKGENAILGYQLINRSFPFGGVWDKGKGQEVGSALNTQLRSVRRSPAPKPRVPDPQTDRGNVTEF